MMMSETEVVRLRKALDLMAVGGNSDHRIAALAAIWAIDLVLGNLRDEDMANLAKGVYEIPRWLQQERR